MVRFATSLMMILAVLAAAAAGNGISQARLLRSDPNSPLMVRINPNNTHLAQPQPQPHEGSQTVARQDKQESSLKLDDKKADKEEEGDLGYTWAEVILLPIVLPLVFVIVMLWIVGGGGGVLPENASDRNFFKMLGRKCSLFRFER